MDDQLCRSCASPVNGNYCSNCGQRVLAVPYNFRFVWDSIVDIFDFNKGFFYTLAQLLVNPGLVISQYLSGNSKRFTNPLKYILNIISIGFAIDLILSLIILDYKHLYADDASFYKNISIVAGLIALFNFVFYRKKNSLIEHLIISTYEVAELLMVSSSIFFLLGVLKINLLANVIFVNIYTVVIISYMAYFQRKVYRSSWGKIIAHLFVVYLIVNTYLFVQRGIELENAATEKRKSK